MLKSSNGRLYLSSTKLTSPYVWRAETIHPHYNRLIFAYAKTQNESYKLLLDKWTYLLNRGDQFPRHVTSQKIGHVKVAKSEGKWKATASLKPTVSRSLTSYGNTVEEAIEQLEGAYLAEEVTVTYEPMHWKDPVYERIVARGYTQAEVDGEPGVNGDSVHKPSLSKDKLDMDLDSIHYRMVCIRMSRSKARGNYFEHHDTGCCDA